MSEETEEREEDDKPDYEGKVVGKMRVRGRSYSVKLRISAGRGAVPSATFVIDGLSNNRYGHSITASLWEGLYKLAMQASKRASVKIEIPIMSYEYARYGDGAHFVSGTIVGRHVGNGNLLVVWDHFAKRGDKAPQQIVDTYHRSQFFKPIQPERQREYIDILKRKKAIEKEESDFEDRYTFKEIDKEVEEEIERKASEITD